MATPSSTEASHFGKWPFPTSTFAVGPKATVEWEITSLADLDRWTQWAVRSLRPIRMALYGDLGAGKTALVQSFGKALCFIEPVNSPTFTLHHQYSLPNGKVAHHFDLYRLRHAEGDMWAPFEEIWENTPIWFVEWPEAAETILQHISHWKIYIKVISPTTRRLLLRQG